MTELLLKLRGLIFEGHSRSVKAKKNVLGSFMIKGGNMLISFIMVPIVLGYLNPEKYGIWITISSIMQYFGFLDIGLGHGLRNRFAEAVARGDRVRAKSYISTTYALLILIMAGVYLIYIIANQFINWSVIFNTSEELNKELALLFFIVFSFFCLRFIVQIINTVLIADQRPAVSDLIKLIAQSISAVTIFILTLTTSSSLIYIGLTYSATPVFVMIIASIYFFRRNYKQYIPSLKFVDFKYAKNLMNLGVKFFMIEIAVIIMFSTDNLIITQLFGPEEVTPYNITFKYFNLIGMTFAIIVNPFWSAFTEAWVKKDVQWIEKIIKKLKQIWFVYFILGVIMIAVAKPVFKLWVGTEIKVPFVLVLIMGIYFIARIYGSIYMKFINGTGKVRMQFYFAMVSTVLNIPLSILFAKYLGLGSAGVILATLVCIVFSPVVAPLQYKLIIRGRAKGIWNK